MMTDFIATGKAYASTLDDADVHTATLVLIALQKLASSSVAAVRRALEGRLVRLKEMTRHARNLVALKAYLELHETGNEDQRRDIEERLAQNTSWLRLMEDEQVRLEELLSVAASLKTETKIEQIIKLVRNTFQDRVILFFTEYKATQSLLMTRLMQEFGVDSTTFINGDEKAEAVLGKTIHARREEAADRFNAGQVRFLVSTEAAGEGIDLQGNCHTLIHVDLPWNPMRLQQRVGRINRYGQRQQVEVVALRNPDTVESLIWEKLNQKINRIQQALGGVMNEPEDLMQLVLGMTSSDLFTNLFSDAATVPKESLSDWFDQHTASFGGRDVLETVATLVGHSTQFDFGTAASQIPRLDLPDLEAFFRLMLSLNSRRINSDGNGLSFLTPDAWRNEIGVLSRYDELVFNRSLDVPDANQRIIGVGHKLMTKALEQAKAFDSQNALLPSVSPANPVVLFKLCNRVTTDETPVRSALLGVVLQSEKKQLLDEEEVFRLLSRLITSRGLLDTPPAQSMPPADKVTDRVVEAERWLLASVPTLQLPFQHPMVQVDAVLWPSADA